MGGRGRSAWPAGVASRLVGRAIGGGRRRGAGLGVALSRGGGTSAFAVDYGTSDGGARAGGSGLRGDERDALLPGGRVVREG